MHLRFLTSCHEEYVSVIILNMQHFLPNISKVLSCPLQIIVRNRAVKLLENTNYKQGNHHQAFGHKDSSGIQEMFRPGKGQRR